MASASSASTANSSASTSYKSSGVGLGPLSGGAAILKGAVGAVVGSSSASHSHSQNGGIIGPSGGGGPGGGVSSGSAGSQHSFILSFSERKARKSQGWFSGEPAVVPWEQWTIRLSVTQSKTERDQLQAKKSIEQQLHSTLLKITQIANDHKDHVPAITTQDSYPFPLQISFNNEQSWGGIIKTLISTSMQ
ncbi:UNVERIFIED_CONTAM: hypothetical protein HDU68_010083 [Siphonaria sp. JEL0065]|nr:hypothetical protein HDU68_010083 [Siphonaria sp. JEL0065]